MDLMDYQDSSAVPSQVDDTLVAMQRSLDHAIKELKDLNRRFDLLRPIAGATGLDISMGTLINLQRIASGQASLERINAAFCRREVFQEVLGVDIRVADRLERFFGTSVQTEDVREIDGITDEIFDRMQRFFVF